MEARKKLLTTVSLVAAGIGCLIAVGASFEGVTLALGASRGDVGTLLLCVVFALLSFPFSVLSAFVFKKTLEGKVPTQMAAASVAMFVLCVMHEAALCLLSILSAYSGVEVQSLAACSEALSQLGPIMGLLVVFQALLLSVAPFLFWLFWDLRQEA